MIAPIPFGIFTNESPINEPYINHNNVTMNDDAIKLNGRRSVHLDRITSNTNGIGDIEKNKDDKQAIKPTRYSGSIEYCIYKCTKNMKLSTAIIGRLILL